MDLPILRRIAEDFDWPPLNIYVYPLNRFPAKFQSRTINPRYTVENELFKIIKNSTLNYDNPKEADLFLVPISISELSIEDFFSLIEHLKTLGPYYKEYNGANHIFIQSKYPSNSTGITKTTFLEHPGHILTEGFVVEGESVKTWVFAKNIVLPLHPFTKFVDDVSTKIDKVAVDVSTDNCTPENAKIRRQLKDALIENSEFDIYKTKEEAIAGIETHRFAIVSACETPMAQQFYDALNSLTIPIVYNNAMRFPFESELIDYTKFVVHLDENSPEKAISVPSKLRGYINEILPAMKEARKMLTLSSNDGEYLWALSWSLYMKLLSWLPTRRTKIIDDIFREPNVFGAA
ncbi:Exostosin family protein [Trichomonas vaginalis G3]|uniref:Exostosin family protein n=1 Tax=Trichomonas vaginalis (strain ATCC PRA-98 / G3) TaxID=412133 RepID=A2FMV1_TRIV3|nr:exostosin family [Trichomonas vaginalis G3]EAX93768.1 Exostosin family protein [Trichomonas vaginalis G3]KAI5535875.1 exostosin family [Trichomonas vaginalis G3]|eukprot:XP_001306698.1 Exostosin family protein [Trichomonas vaginalis G3]